MFYMMLAKQNIRNRMNLYQGDQLDKLRSYWSIEYYTDSGTDTCARKQRDSLLLDTRYTSKWKLRVSRLCDCIFGKMKVGVETDIGKRRKRINKKMNEKCEKIYIKIYRKSYSFTINPTMKNHQINYVVWLVCNLLFQTFYKGTLF